MNCTKAVYDFTAYPRSHTHDSQSIHMPFDVIIGSYGSSPPKEKGVPCALLFPLVEIVGRSQSIERISSSRSEARAFSPRDILFELGSAEFGVRLPIISTTHYHVSGKMKESTDVVKLYLLCRCSLFLASVGWAKQSLPVFDKFVVGVCVGIGLIFRRCNTRMLFEIA